MPRRSARPASAASDADVATYLYCVVEAPRIDLAGVPRGLPGAGKPRAEPLKPGRWMIVCDAPLARYGPEAIERATSELRWVATAAVKHSEVVSFFARDLPVVPMKMFTLFSDDRRATRALLRKGQSIDRTLKHIRGCAEWGVHILPAPRRAAARRAPAPRSGRAFLVAKREKLAGARDDRAHQRAEALRALGDLESLSRAAQMREAQAATGPVVDGVLLVPNAAKARLAARCDRWREQLQKRGLSLRVTGPWPCYHFVGAR